MNQRGIGIVRVTSGGVSVEFGEKMVLPPGHELNCAIPMSAVDGDSVEYEIRPAKGLHAWWLRWQYERKQRHDRS